MLATMVGYNPAATQGHFTSGGTVANFEAVWRARYRLDHWGASACTGARSSTPSPPPTWAGTGSGRCGANTA